MRLSCQCKYKGTKILVLSQGHSSLCVKPFLFPQHDNTKASEGKWVCGHVLITFCHWYAHLMLVFAKKKRFDFASSIFWAAPTHLQSWGLLDYTTVNKHQQLNSDLPGSWFKVWFLMWEHRPFFWSCSFLSLSTGVCTCRYPVLQSLLLDQDNESLVDVCPQC